MGRGVHGDPGHTAGLAPAAGRTMPLLELLKYCWMQGDGPGRCPARGSEQLALGTVGILRVRSFQQPVGNARPRGPLSSLRPTLDASMSMKSAIFVAVVTVRAITLRRTCLRTLRKEMRCGSIPAPAASSMMILVSNGGRPDASHASWHARWGLAERRVCCGPRWNILIWRYGFRLPPFAIEGREFGSRICPGVKQ